MVGGSSSPTRLTLRMPLYNGSNVVVRLQDGQTVSYSLANSSGTTPGSGNILWRSVNGTPDSVWARITASTGGLQFIYTPTVNPETVRITLTTSRKEGGRTWTFTTSQEVLLRNHGL